MQEPGPQRVALITAAFAAAGVALPFLLALPAHYDPEVPWATAGICTLVVAVFAAAQFAAQRVARVAGSHRFIAAFAVLNTIIGLLGFISLDKYRLIQPLTDLALLYVVFFAAAAATQASGTLGRLVLGPLAFAFVLVAVIQAMHLDAFGFPIAADGYRAILQSNPGEALEFIGRHLGAVGIAAACFALAAGAAVALGVAPPRASREALGWAAVFALPVAALLVTHFALVEPRLHAFSETVDYVAEILEHRAVRQARRVQPPAGGVSQEGPLAGQAQTYVIVVGESLTRNHMSLYGYWRATTPQLERLRSEMAVLEDVVSPHSHTDQSLELVLTLANNDNALRFTDAQNYSLIELLRTAGFATWWISNQNTFGPWDNKVSVLAAAAEHVHYTGRRSGAMVSGPHDEALIEPFAAALSHPAPRKAIFLHFLGNHWEYAKRYPPQAASFRRHASAAEIGALSSEHPRPQLVNEYDDAVRYHDQTVGKIVELLRATHRPAALVLLSDHGESLYALKGHYWREFTHDHVEVPLTLWFSPQYREIAGDIVSRAQANATAAFALEDLPHLVGDLAGLTSPMLEPKRSPLSASYRAPQARHLFERGLVYEEADQPALNARRALRSVAQARPKIAEKLWAHRVNTLGKMMQAARIFSGVEIDVLYDAEQRTLMVNHPPEPLSGLTLEALLEYANRINPRLALWLDLKNFNETNGLRFVQELERIDVRHAIRARALVETEHTGPAAAALRSAGFRSSYYLPTSLITQDDNGSNSSCYGAEQIRRAVLARRFSGVSYDWRGRHWVEHCLGAFVRESRLRRYAWDLELVLSDAKAHETLDRDRLDAYSALSAVLVPYRSLFDDKR